MDKFVKCWKGCGEVTILGSGQKHMDVAPGDMV